MFWNSLQKEFRKVFSSGSGLGSIEEKLFVIGVACVLIVELCGMIMNMRHDTGVRMFFTLSAALVMTMAVIVMAYRKKDFSMSYTILCLQVNVLVLPLVFINNGGFNSGVPIYMLMGFLLIGCQLDKKMRYIVSGVVLAVDGILFALAFRYPAMITSIPSEFVVSSIITAIILCGVSTLLMMSLFLNSYSDFSKKNLREYEQKTAMRMTLLESQVENIEDVKRQRHNMRHHNQIIMEYAKKKDMKGLRRYLQEKQYSDEFYSKKFYCRNVVINNILTIYAKIAESKGIEFEARTDVASELNLGDKDLTTLVSTVVENAVNGAENSGREHPRVDLTIREKGRRLIMNCSNTCADDLPTNQKYPGTPGSGTEEVETILDANGGLLDYEVGDGRVNCRVIIDAISTSPVA